MLKAYINRYPYELASDFEISEKTGSKISSTFTVRVDGQPFPRAGDILEVKDNENNVNLFLGVIGIPKSPVYRSTLDPNEITLTCNNANAILGRRYANVAYEDKYVHEIVSAIFNKYVIGEGIMLGTISETAIKLNKYVAGDKLVNFVLDELATLVGGTWVITNDRVFHFMVQEDFPKYSRTITSEFLLGSEMQRAEKSMDLRTVQIVNGATERTSKQTEEFLFDSSEPSVFNVDFALAEQPIIYINGNEVDASRVGIYGLDEFSSDESSVWFLWGSQSKMLRYNTQCNQLKIGDTLKVEYIGTFGIRVTVRNEEAIADMAERTGFSGVIENSITNYQLQSQADVRTYANGLLENFGKSQGEVRFWGYIRQFKQIGVDIGQLALNTQVAFALPEINITGAYVIVERTFRPFVYDYDGTMDNLRVDFKLVDRNFVQSYGDTLNAYQREKGNLSIREDDQIIDTDPLSEEIITLSEEVEIAAQIVNRIYCTSISEFSATGSLASPLILPGTDCVQE